MHIVCVLDQQRSLITYNNDSPISRNNSLFMNIWVRTSGIVT